MTCTITDHLDIDALAAVSSFLPKTSRALFALALTAPSQSWRKADGSGWRGEPSKAGKAVLLSCTHSATFSSAFLKTIHNDIVEVWGDGDERFPGELAVVKQLQHSRMKEYYTDGRWGILDFIDIQRSLASKLTDVDIGALLMCIGAKDSLKKLHLPHLVNFVGRGLDPLRGSSVLEHIDLDILRFCPSFRRLGGYEKRKRLAKPCISHDAVFPVLEDILRSSEGNALSCMLYPCEWRDSLPMDFFEESVICTMNLPLFATLDLGKARKS